MSQRALKRQIQSATKRKLEQIHSIVETFNQDVQTQIREKVKPLLEMLDRACQYPINTIEVTAANQALQNLFKDLLTPPREGARVPNS